MGSHDQRTRHGARVRRGCPEKFYTIGQIQAVAKAVGMESRPLGWLMSVAGFRAINGTRGEEGAPVHIRDAREDRGDAGMDVTPKHIWQMPKSSTK